MHTTIPAKLRSHRTPSRPLSAGPTIASRKTCNPEGTGLSHYVLVHKKAAK